MIIANIECPFDGPYGEIYFRICPNNNLVFLMCNECDLIFLTPKNLKLGIEVKIPRNLDFDTPNFDQFIPDIGSSLNETREATLEEINEYGWKKYIK